MTTAPPARRRVLSIAVTGLLAATGAAALAGPADARPVLWGGTGSNDVGPGTILLSVQNGRVGVRSVQAVMACVDTGDGTESDRAFSVVGHSTVPLRLNRYSMTFTASSGGRTGRVRLTGQLRSNGRGTTRLVLTATGRDSGTGAIIERCQATVDYTLRRGA